MTRYRRTVHAAQIDVVMGLPKFSWGQIFSAVDCISRNGRVFLRQVGYSTYEMSLSQLAYSSSTSSQTEHNNARPSIDSVGKFYADQPESKASNSRDDT